MRTPYAIPTIIITAFAIGASAAGASVGPRFEDLEHSGLAASLVGDAVPAGTAISDAEASLRRLGASCRPTRAHRATERCDYVGPSMFDGDLIESVYWTVALNVEDGRVAGIAVKRTLDIH